MGAEKDGRQHGGTARVSVAAFELVLQGQPAEGGKLDQETAIVVRPSGVGVKVIDSGSVDEPLREVDEPAGGDRDEGQDRTQDPDDGFRAAGSFHHHTLSVA